MVAELRILLELLELGLSEHLYRVLIVFVSRHVNLFLKSLR